MAKLHQGIALDDRFSKAMLKVQKAIEDLTLVADDFDIGDHSPVQSQIYQLENAGKDLTELAAKYKKIKAK